MQIRLNALQLSVVIEHYMAGANRCDITASTVIDGREHVLVIEAKGQWHAELFSAVSEQLADKYTIYPGAAHQGIYLVFWFGQDVPVAGAKGSGIRSAEELRNAILQRTPDNLRHLLDVIVLDLSRPTDAGKIGAARSGLPNGEGAKTVVC